MDEAQTVDSSDLDLFEVRKAAVIQKREDLKKLFENKNQTMELLIPEYIDGVFDEAVRFIKSAIAMGQLSCAIIHEEYPYVSSADAERMHYLTLQAVMDKLQKEPYNLTIYEKSEDNILKALNMGGNLENIKVTHKWDISCLVANL